MVRIFKNSLFKVIFLISICDYNNNSSIINDNKLELLCIFEIRSFILVGVNFVQNFFKLLIDKIIAEIGVRNSCETVDIKFFLIFSYSINDVISRKWYTVPIGRIFSFKAASA